MRFGITEKLTTDCVSLCNKPVVNCWQSLQRSSNPQKGRGGEGIAGMKGEEEGNRNPLAGFYLPDGRPLTSLVDIVTGGQKLYSSSGCDHCTAQRRKDRAWLRLKPWLQWFDYDTTIPRRILLRRKWSKLRFECDKKNWHANFLLASNRGEWKQARAIRRSRIVVVS